MIFKELAKNTGLDEDEFLEMVELFLEVGSSDLNKLQTAIDEENVQEVIEAAHSITGASGNMGFMEIFELAKGVEVKAREDSLDGAAEAVKSIKEKLDLIAETLR